MKTGQRDAASSEVLWCGWPVTRGFPAGLNGKGLWILHSVSQSWWHRRGHHRLHSQTTLKTWSWRYWMVYLEFTKRVDLNCSQPSPPQRKWQLCDVMGTLTGLIVAIPVSKHPTVHLKYTPFLFVSYTSIRLIKYIMLCWEHLPLISDLCRCSGKREDVPTQQSPVQLITRRILR